MADSTDVHIGENSPEFIAYQLLKDVTRVEGIPLGALTPSPKLTRKYILDTYAECLNAVKFPGSRIPD